MKRTRHTITPEEHIQNLKDQFPKKKNLPVPRTSFLDGFEKLEEGYEIYLYDSEKEASINYPCRNATMADLFYYFFNDDFIDSMIEKNVARCNQNELPPLLYKNSLYRKDLVIEKRNLVKKFFYTKFLIMADHQSKLEKNWPHCFKEVKKGAENSKQKYLGRNLFQQMLSNFYITLDSVKEMNEILNGCFNTGRYVVLDEKHFGTNKDNHLARWVHGKDPQWGHWNSELAAVGPTTGMPICKMFMPLTSTDVNKVTIEPYNNFELKDVHAEVIKNLEEDTIIVEDAYYLDDKSRKLLRDKNIMYISAINVIRFKEVWVECEKYVKNMGDWVVLYNSETEEHAMMKWDAVRERKYYVLTNAFRNRKISNFKKDKKDINTIAAIYELLFNSCDRYNKYLSNKIWPYTRFGWQASFDEVFFSGICMNVYTMYHELQQLDVDNKIEWEEFCHLMAESLESSIVC